MYILECADKSYYTGYTNDLGKRVKEHNDTKRGAKYLRGKKPVKLVWKKEYKRLHYAMKAEYNIKQLTRLQKENLVKGNIKYQVLTWDIRIIKKSRQKSSKFIFNLL